MMSTHIKLNKQLKRKMSPSKQITLDINRPLLFIDGSYFIFYRYYAIFNWWSKQNENKGRSGADAMSDPVFKEKYHKLFKSVILNLQKLHEVPPTNLVFAKDCSREAIWRNEHFDSYKGTRDDMRMNNFDSRVFSETLDNIIPEIDCPVLYVNHLEADDVIAVAVKEVIAANPEADITIITNDNDYVQLCSLSDTINIVNLQGKPLKTRIEIKDLSKYLLYKTIIGDKADNIPSISKNVGPKTAEKLAMQPEELQRLFEKNPAAKEQFDKNDRLINFAHIPAQLQDKVRHLLKLS